MDAHGKNTDDIDLGIAATTDHAESSHPINLKTHSPRAPQNNTNDLLNSKTQYYLENRGGHNEFESQNWDYF